MSDELDHFVVANAAKIPCTVRTLRPFWLSGKLKPWCHSSELMDAVQYLGLRAGLPDEEIRALKELHAKVSSSLSNLSESLDHPQADEVDINEQ